MNIFKSPNQDPTLRKLDRFVEVFMLAGILSIILLVCCSCGSTKAVTQLVEHTSVDTVYLSNTHYDSVYIYQDRLHDHRLGTLEPSGTLKPDTLYIRDVSVEYRYKMLRDTIYKTQVDSIPYQVTVTEIKEIKRPLTWFDHLSRICFGICLSGLLIVLYKLRYFRSGGILNH